MSFCADVIVPNLLFEEKRKVSAGKRQNTFLNTTKHDDTLVLYRNLKRCNNIKIRVM
jgi:hypothetical protein